MTHPLTEELERLIEWEKVVTPGPWKADPKRLTINGQQGPIMCYLAGDASQPEGMKVSLASERLADHHFIAALRNFFPSLRDMTQSAERRLTKPAWVGNTPLGWECPRCGAIHAPSVLTCRCSGPLDGGQPS